MTKLYFKNQQEFVNFILEIAKNSKFLTINNVTFITNSCDICICDNSYIDMVDKQKTVICSMLIKGIHSLNEYKIIMEVDNEQD